MYTYSSYIVEPLLKDICTCTVCVQPSWIVGSVHGLTYIHKNRVRYKLNKADYF